MLDFLIEQRGVKQADVARGTGIAESTISELIRGKRRLTRGQLEKLSGYFHVSGAVFLADVEGNGNK
jgi:HTH-type transcriptional regulator/antitoxin HigA